MSHFARCVTLVGIAFAPIIVPIARAQAALAYVSIPSIAGEDPTPGYPDAMAAQSVTVVPGGFSIVKIVDAASPDVFGAVVAGTPLGTASLLLYNTGPSGPPDAKLQFPNVLGSAYQLLGGGDIPAEKDTFSATTPAAIYLELPGITGESSTPGHPGVMQIQSLSMEGSAFSVVKPVDVASPDILLAVANGTHFSTASVLFYNSLVPLGQPDATLVFHNVLASAYHSLGRGDQPLEQDAFNFAGLSQPIPEPAPNVMMAIGVVLTVGVCRRISMTVFRRAAAS